MIMAAFSSGTEKKTSIGNKIEGGALEDKRVHAIHLPPQDVKVSH